jgi:hypothetical protein
MYECPQIKNCYSCASVNVGSKPKNVSDGKEFVMDFSGKLEAPSIYVKIATRIMQFEY